MGVRPLGVRVVSVWVRVVGIFFFVVCVCVGCIFVMIVFVMFVIVVCIFVVRVSRMTGFRGTVRARLDEVNARGGVDDLETGVLNAFEDASGPWLHHVAGIDEEIRFPNGHDVLGCGLKGMRFDAGREDEPGVNPIPCDDAHKVILGE